MSSSKNDQEESLPLHGSNPSSPRTGISVQHYQATRRQLLVAKIIIVLLFSLLSFASLGYLWPLDDFKTSDQVGSPNSEFGFPAGSNETAEIPKLHKVPSPHDPFIKSPVSSLPSSTSSSLESLRSNLTEVILVADIALRQSKTLEEARAKYLLQYQRAPPPGFDAWFKFASDRKCLIDEYELLQNDLEPFRKMGKKEYQRRVSLLSQHEKYSATMTFQSGTVKTSSNHNYARVISRVAPLVPDSQIVINLIDEPRCIVNHTNLRAAVRNAATQHAHNSLEWIDPRDNHATWFQERCKIEGHDLFTDDLNDNYGFAIRPDTSSYVESVLPLVSPTKIRDCFTDILTPSFMYYGRAVKPDHVPWSSKKNKLFWRGSSTGGHANPDGNWRHFHRHKAAAMTKAHPDLVDIGITQMLQCEEAACREAQASLGLAKFVPLEGHYEYKYLLDMDGNTYSARFFDLLRSRSVVFRMKVFGEFFDNWLQPFVHYIPVEPDLSDLVDKVKWAVENDALAEQIAKNGHEFTNQFLTDDAFDCYTALTLIEMAALG